MSEFQPWELHLFGEVINSDYIKPSLAEKVETETKIRWPALRVAANVTGEAGTLRKVAAVLIADRLNLTVDEAHDKIDAECTFATLVDAVVLVNDDKPTVYHDGLPKAEADEDSITS